MIRPETAFYIFLGCVRLYVFSKYLPNRALKMTVFATLILQYESIRMRRRDKLINSSGIDSSGLFLNFKT